MKIQLRFEVKINVYIKVCIKENQMKKQKRWKIITKISHCLYAGRAGYFFGGRRVICGSVFSVAAAPPVGERFNDSPEVFKTKH